MKLKTRDPKKSHVTLPPSTYVFSYSTLCSNTSLHKVSAPLMKLQIPEKEKVSMVS